MSVGLLVEVVGWLGAAALLLAYGLLSSGRIAAGTTYQLLNLAGAVALAVNGVVHRALPSVAVNVVWLVIGLAALRGLATRRPARQRTESHDEPAQPGR
ncbi:hypothetical protein ACFQZ4_34195 [Catellatospora coxensis]|uniref:CBU-0592-like domain-containing protein n=1 Tax=Catellatospora coxensis TaxID=310354 RepID=A0A8J3KY82_9ACTN|nr:hypothetical protein [Catellatospora coxensis]GIG04255.1 hypothetical protein Cco03nite_09550 [Catellatospora coxensis]